MYQTNRTTILAYLSAGFGIFSFPAFFCGAIGATFFGIPAVILGIIALVRGTKSTPEKAAAIVGIMLGAVATIISLVLVIGLGFYLFNAFPVK